MQNFGKKKFPKFGAKNTLFGYFGVRILRNYCHIEISTLKFVKLRNFRKKQKYLNFVKKWKCLNLGPKMLDSGIFALEFKNSNLKFVISESLTHAMNFGIGSAFLKVRGLLFLKVRVWVRSINYAMMKVCQHLHMSNAGDIDIFPLLFLAIIISWGLLHFYRLCFVWNFVSSSP